jgi:zinc/manganese transport system substrate-binding protein
MRIFRLPSPRARLGRTVLAGAALAGAGLLATACSSSGSGHAAGAPAASNKLVAVGAENEYADVISQIGGQYVAVSAIMSDPNTDPHTFEASPKVAAEVAGASLVVQNGIGYDDFMATIEKADPNASRKVIDVQNLLGLPDTTPNPHLWYKPATMPATAAAIAADLEALDPAHKASYAANLATFTSSLTAWNTAVAQLKAQYGGDAVATTEPVADYLLETAGLNNLTPFTFQAAIMNGTDPSPQDVTIQKALFTGHKIKAFVYNQQVTDTLTQSLLTLARQNHIPVVGVYETMPTPGYTYQSWMLAEVGALSNALGDGTSAPTL